MEGKRGGTHYNVAVYDETLIFFLFSRGGKGGNDRGKKKGGKRRRKRTKLECQISILHQLRTKKGEGGGRRRKGTSV